MNSGEGAYIMLACIGIACIVLFIIESNDPNLRHEKRQTEVKEKYTPSLDSELRIYKMSQMFIDRYIGNDKENTSITLRATNSPGAVHNGINVKKSERNIGKQSHTQNRPKGIETSISKGIDQEMKLRLGIYEQQVRALLN